MGSKIVEFGEDRFAIDGDVGPIHLTFKGSDANREVTLKGNNKALSLNHAPATALALKFPSLFPIPGDNRLGFMEVLHTCICWTTSCLLCSACSFNLFHGRESIGIVSIALKNKRLRRSSSSVDAPSLQLEVSISLFLTELDKRNLLGLVILLIFTAFTFTSRSHGFFQSSLLCFALSQVSLL